MPMLRAIAFAELLGVIGLIGPWWTGIAPVLTPLAAAGLGIVMVGAAITHLRLNEPLTALANLAILAVCVFIAASRFAELG
jgi:hypothetical protein